MKQSILNLYKVTWRSTANTYIATRTENLKEIEFIVRQKENRCDDIIKIEAFELILFDNDELLKSNKIIMFTDFNIF